MRKSTVVISTSSILKIIKSIKIIFKKIITKKITWGKIVTINGVLKKKTIKLNFQPVQYEKNKFDKDNFRKKIDKKTCGKTLEQEKIMWGNTVAIHNVFFQDKNNKVKLSINSI
jgi:hypothetical protein